MKKFVETKERALRTISIQVEPSLYNRISEVVAKVGITKKVLINTAIISMLEDIQSYGVDLR